MAGLGYGSGLERELEYSEKSLIRNSNRGYVFADGQGEGFGRGYFLDSVSHRRGSQGYDASGVTRSGRPYDIHKARGGDYKDVGGSSPPVGGQGASVFI